MPDTTPQELHCHSKSRPRPLPRDRSQYGSHGHNEAAPTTQASPNPGLILCPQYFSDPFTPGQGSLNHTLPTLNPDQAILPGLLGPTSWLGPAQVFQGPAPSPLGPAPALQAPPNGEAGFCSR